MATLIDTILCALFGHEASKDFMGHFISDCLRCGEDARPSWMIQMEQEDRLEALALKAMEANRRKVRRCKVEAGLSLDQLIAEKVMGWYKVGKMWCVGANSFAAQAEELDGCPEVWAPSTKISDAFKVHEQLGRLMRLTDFGPFAWHCEFLAVQPSQVDVEAKAETAPLAICTAALLAVESNEKEG